MRRAAFVLLVAGGLGAAALWLLGTPSATTSWFVAWLFWIGVPMGALPIVAGTEAAGTMGAPLLPVLRPMLLLLPLGTLFALPLLSGLSTLFGHPGLPGWWTAPATMVWRDGGILIGLSVLALIFALRPRRPRRGFGAFTLLLSLCLVTVLAVDVVLAPQPALGSSLAGLLLMAGQMALAGSLAGVVLAVGTAARARLPGGAGLLIALLTGFWLFLQFVQFLVVWSANLPAEAAWYLARLPGLGTTLIVFAALAALAAATLLPSMLGRVPVALATLASMVALALLGATLLYVVPAYRGTFAPTFADLLALVGVGGLLVGALLLVPIRPEIGRA